MVDATVRAMTFPKKHLNEGETIALDMHPHWWYFAEPALTVAATIVAGIWVYFLDDGAVKDLLRPIIIVVLVGSAIWLVFRAATWQNTEFVITSQRVIFRQGLIAKRGMEIPLDRVNNVNFSQSMFERMLGAGDLLIESGGEDGQQRFTDIKDPSGVQNLLHREVEKVRNRRSNAAPTATTMSVPEQLERLEGLLQRGSITPEEYESQKRKLLD
jgi:uncharacterized membrane protein YdbT with pleckstrin-like domain